MAKVLGIGGIFFKSPDPQELCQWYAQWLGIHVEVEPGTFALFFPGTMPQNGYTVWSAFESTTTYFAPSENAFMFNLVVDNLGEALSQVKAGGGQMVGEVEKSDYGQFGWFMDPDGNKVELWQPPDL
ncbi:MAG: glyoxalase [Chloroflexi bacterium RBG_13_50_21]|nr:MAG: glyoxalase [Chloroflexi bacterium RBG_13_50_21]OGO64565.1 MAG: glyoxalase [Chloroflexi bacterium RBG_19FT_COMBO_50_10]